MRSRNAGARDGKVRDHDGLPVLDDLKQRASQNSHGTAGKGTGPSPRSSHGQPEEQTVKHKSTISPATFGLSVAFAFDVHADAWDHILGFEAIRRGFPRKWHTCCADSRIKERFCATSCVKHLETQHRRRARLLPTRHTFSFSSKNSSNENNCEQGQGTK